MTHQIASQTVTNDLEHHIEHVATGPKAKFRIFGMMIIWGHWDAIGMMLGSQEDITGWIRHTLQLGMGCICSMLVAIV